ncbi:hypothetical protein [Pararhizobium sp. LjRoot238]|uniref:hypothetical protein n=1 Tax=Pararhizobium sp. LjRoot238 TaxID=3342293 RepID=UPI003ECC1D09
MADSDNSRTLSTVTWDDLHSLLAADLPTFQMPTASLDALQDAEDTDPALIAWRQWCVSWQRLTEATLLQQLLEKSFISGGLTPRSAAGSFGPTVTERQYNDALEAEDLASISEDWAAEALWNTPAVSVAGAGAKLLAIASKWAPSPTSLEEPWPQIRNIIADLLKINLELGTGRLSAPEHQPVFRNG